MIAFYDTITSPVQGWWDAKNVTACGQTVRYPAERFIPIPGNQVRSYVPLSEQITKSDPSKGRSFSKLKKDGRILVSPYSKGSVKTESFVVSAPHRFEGRNSLSIFEQDPAHCCHYEDLRLATSWTQNDDLRSLSEGPGALNLIRDSYFDESEIQKAIDSTQTAAFADALSGYDILTELGELRETSAFLLSKVGGIAGAIGKLRDKDPQTYDRARRLTGKQMQRHADKLIRKLGGRWMEYRYAIMPLFYSMRDISEIAKQGQISFRSSRNREIIGPTTGLNLNLAERYLHSTCEGEVQVRSFVKKAFSSTGLRNVYETSISMNPFKTAWELIPLSFVVDWALNVGDAITAHTSVDFADQTACTTSIRRKYKETTFLRDRSFDQYHSVYGANPCRPALDQLWQFHRNVDAPVQIVTYDTYERFLFSTPALKITFSPSMNWKRYVDALVLGYSPVRKLLRRL